MVERDALTKVPAVTLGLRINGAVVVAAAMILLAINPLGYQGGGGDDWHYLQAARCVASEGWCIPSNHWSARWPLVLPLGGVLALLGESRWSVSLVPLAYGVASLFLLTRLVNRRFGRPEALLAGLVFVASPVFADAFARPNVDLPELTFLLGALVLLQSGRNPKRAVAAGLLLALAIETRPTALVCVGLIAVGLALTARPWRFPAALIGGIGIGLLASFALHWVASGDPLIAWKLAAQHTRIPSTELPPGVDLSHSPILNPAFIGAWVPAAGIDAHWTIRGLVNLVVNPKIASWLIIPVVLACGAWPRIRGGPDARLLLTLGGAAAAIFAGLTYVLAVDPKPRMFISLVVIGAVVTAVLVLRLRPSMKLLPTVSVGILLLTGLAYRNHAPDVRQLEVAARQLADGLLPVETGTRRVLTLMPHVRRAPLYSGTERRVVAIGMRRCDVTLSPLGPGIWRVERALSTNTSGPIPMLEWSSAIFGSRETLMLCQLRRA